LKFWLFVAVKEYYKKEKLYPIKKLNFNNYFETSLIESNHFLKQSNAPIN